MNLFKLVCVTNSVIIKGHNEEIDSSLNRKRKTRIKKKIYERVKKFLMYN